ncbi:hypothetical protein [uncultured Nostoc sp.]|uniref:hypothetical protein n=1 Tax=uncultured Nostoc sp. TaxID=340711 RepID=UPI0035CB30C1
MADKWLKANCLLASATAFWLAALSPVPPIAKGISYSLALVAAVQLVTESKLLILQSARRAVLAVMNQELEDVEIALHTQQQEEALHEIYGTSPTYPQEVEQELKTSLEHLYKEPSADRAGELQTSTSEKKALYLAVKSLIEVKGKTYVLEKVLCLSGGQWDKGEQVLKQLLEEGQRNGW